MRRTPIGLAFGVAIALIAVGLPMLLFQARGGGDELAGPDEGPQPAVTTPSATQAVIPELQDFVARARGLAFKRPVRVQVLEGEAFERRIRSLTRMSVVEARRRQRVLQALGLIGPDVDLNQVQQMLNAATVLGIYDPATSSLVVRGKEPTPLLRSVLVHELTHAVQDQHFDLSRQQRRLRRSAQGMTAVIEGDATRIQTAYVQAFTTAERAAMEREQAEMAAAIPSDVPPALAALNSFAYRVGERFTSTVVALSGQKVLDAAFTEPPSTAEQLLHPDRFIAEEEAVTVAAPPADGRVVQVDTFGEYALSVLLDGAVPEEQVTRATQGWGGDRYVAWADGRRDCVRMNIVMDTRTDADELAEALSAWAAASGATVEGRAPIVVTSCH